jgi:hypothetical protein
LNGEAEEMETGKKAVWSICLFSETRKQDRPHAVGIGKRKMIARAAKNGSSRFPDTLRA